MNKLALFLTVLNFIGSAQAAPKMDARTIMQKNDEVRRLNDMKTEAKLTTGDFAAEKSGTGLKIKDFTLSRKVQADKIHNSTLTRFHAPAEVRNEGILIVENASGRNDVLLYLPTYKKIRRVESQQQSGSFMGSAFSYSDIATPHVDDFQYRLLKEEKCPSPEASAQNCWVIEATPANDDVRERTGYSKSVLWVRQDNFMSVANDLYGLDGQLFKKLTNEKIKEVDAKNHKWLALDMTIHNSKTQEFTHLEFSNVKVNSGISDSVFTQQNLQKVQ